MPVYNSTGPGHLPNACHVAHQQTANPAVCWRADDEHLRRDGAAWVRINALAFGAERRFDYRAVRDGTTGVAKSMKLRAGDLRKVTGGMQTCYQHRAPAMSQAEAGSGPRLWLVGLWVGDHVLRLLLRHCRPMCGIWGRNPWGDAAALCILVAGVEQRALGTNDMSCSNGARSCLSAHLVSGHVVGIVAPRLQVRVSWLRVRLAEAVRGG